MTWRGLLHAPTLPDDVALVCDAPPRSGQTWFVEAFEDANPKVVTSHHKHHPGMIVQASRRGVPAIALVRDPAASVASFYVYDERPLAHLLARWCDFYETALGASVIFAPFRVAVTDPGEVIARANDRYGTSFQRFMTDADSRERIAARIDEQALKRWPGDVARHVARPHPGRQAALDAAWEQVAELSDFDHAVDIYQEVLERVAPVLRVAS